MWVYVSISFWWKCSSSCNIVHSHNAILVVVAILLTIWAIACIQLANVIVFSRQMFKRWNHITRCIGGWRVVTKSLHCEDHVHRLPVGYYAVTLFKQVLVTIYRDCFYNSNPEKSHDISTRSEAFLAVWRQTTGQGHASPKPRRRRGCGFFCGRSIPFWWKCFKVRRIGCNVSPLNKNLRTLKQCKHWKFETPL